MTNPRRSHYRSGGDSFTVVKECFECLATVCELANEVLLSDDAFFVLEPSGVVEETLSGTGSTSLDAIPSSSRYASKVCTPAASRCQSGPERKHILSGMCSCQKDIGPPTTIVSIPCSIARAAVATPYGPAPITRSSELSIKVAAYLIDPPCKKYTDGCTRHPDRIPACLDE